ncbi:acyl-CoA dehydrogenase family protein [Gordonia alkanivorans]|uniref:acyl-CoA dehydrogenase family protein n=1 Tax=Gordonia alkanivorans TaxID=84096 RepID=UPI0024492DD6|nr:acyl-CoA dehydrogenase family protein [Gordonia alkanivorans]MDH3047233.1 acyl-CoA/acyl-ACP dehydrogenase [Gordonia alkanivorans]
MSANDISPEELEDLRTTVRDILAQHCDDAAVRAAIGSEAGFDRSLWQLLANEVGLHALAMPEVYGGDGFGLSELGVVLGEMGAAVMPGPFLTSVVIAGGALLMSDDSAALTAHLPGIADGSTIATLAVIESDGAWRTDGFTVVADEASDGWVLSGEKSLVPDGNTAHLILVAATTPTGPSLFAVDAGAAGLARTPLRTLDLTRPMSRLTFDRTPAILVGTSGDAPRILSAVLDRATAALAAEQVGAARACLEMSVAYAKEREQFGRKIGSFQAVKHKLADMFTRVTLADAAATEALRAADGRDDAPPASVAAAVAHSVCSDAFMYVAAETIQVHGGIGFTWEHPAHLFFRRAKADQLMFGGPGVYHERLLNRLGV